tara:strand:- start:4987 stop:5136 length:150 start_codon:yes stop_codon:yes gene_type:complete
MLITKEQLEAIVNNYIKSGNNQDACIGFIDGVEKVMELITKIETKNEKQ